jgi:hypothetical protein
MGRRLATIWLPVDEPVFTSLTREMGVNR